MNNNLIEEAAVYIKKYAPKYEIKVYSPILAQIIIESASGKSELAVTSNNYLGIKYKPGRCAIALEEPYIKVGTEQKSDGSFEKKEMKWFRFRSLEDCILGYFQFTNTKRYSNLKNVTDAATYARLIKEDEYASDINYTQKLIDTIKKHKLYVYDEKIETEKGGPMVVAIDAGHGSQTPGKRSPDGYREHWANVQAAIACEKALKRCGLETVQSGYNDENSRDDLDISLSQRQTYIRSKKSKVSVSFHFNAFGDGKTYNSAEGIESFYHANAESAKDSKRLAEYIQKHLIEGTKQKNRGVKTANFALCNAKTMGTDASVLIECGFMTNKKEEELMKRAEFCTETGEEAAHGICEYLGVTYVKPNQTAAEKITAESFLVRVQRTDLKIRTGPSSITKDKGNISPGVYTIVSKSGDWGKLKSGVGWIHLGYVTKL